ncbi:hypothetical protein AA14337_2210 [Acetobacter malorum DSM 14337]|uniref:Outer membrane protein n=1 Tax=Acetobacter malorum DSM 14337 TaxID=1307910 RepID=A0ABQ0PUV5_9PROT|nr:hypothetical protein [Acetobacter malorum]GBQ82008.1 hypothetical protein AA14337_2210 [Acetobacter malorum DSM 14337]
MFPKLEKANIASHIFSALFMFLPETGYAQTPSTTLHATVPLAGSFYKTAPDPRLYDRFNVADDWTHLGAFNVERSTTPPMAFEQGTTVTLAYPVKGVRGLDLVVNTFGGHRLTSTGSHIASAAVTAGLRLKW